MSVKLKIQKPPLPLVVGEGGEDAAIEILQTMLSHLLNQFLLLPLSNSYHGLTSAQKVNDVPSGESSNVRLQGWNKNTDSLSRLKMEDRSSLQEIQEMRWPPNVWSITCTSQPLKMTTDQLQTPSRLWLRRLMCWDLAISPNST